MTRKNRSVHDRQKSLQPPAPKGHLTLAGARLMYEGMQADTLSCTISAHCRTRIFEFPRLDLRGNNNTSNHSIYESSPVHACIVSNLLDFFTNATRSRHYSISPSLRHEVGETYEKVAAQNKGGTPVFLIIEESNALTPVAMTNGECSICDEVRERDGEEVPYIIGGREGEQFITAWHTSDGAWPDLPENQQLVNLILAGVRVGQETSDPIRKFVDQSCLVTNDGRFVVTMRPTMSARVGTASVMNTEQFQEKASEIRNVIAAMKSDIGIPHVALLVDSMYREEHEDDAYQRLQYLRLWESLAEAGEKYLNYQGNVRTDDVVLAGKRSLRELKQYRDDIAHWWTDSSDENLLADLLRTINELIRRKYF